MPPEPAPDAPPPVEASLPAIDWLALCRRVVDAHRAVFEEHAGIAARSVYEGLGEGGDLALAIDRRCEDAVFAELEALHGAGHSFTAISEERGEVVFGESPNPPLVVIDPIDGSLNARRTIPSHSLSIAVAAGPSMADVEFGYVYDFGTGEEFVASRSGGATLGGLPMRLDAEPAEKLEVVGLEAAAPGWIAPLVARLEGHVYRFRAVGSIAISLAYVAAGRFDGLVTARACRSVDAAAGQLIAREAGAEVAFGDGGLADAALALDARYPLLAASTPEGIRLLAGGGSER